MPSAKNRPISIGTRHATAHVKARANMTLMTWLSVFLTACVVLPGCAFGPPYTYTRQNDSAAVLVAPSSSLSIYIQRVDQFAAPSAMRLGSSSGSYEAYLSPGRHVLDVDCYYSQGIGNRNATANYSIQGGGYITAQFAANRQYRLRASLDGRTFTVELWDETAGPSAGTLAGQWQFKGDINYQSNP